MSLFVLTFISIDRLLALSLGVQYRQTVTTGRVRAFVLVSWVLNVVNGVALLSRNKFVFYIVCITAIFLCVSVNLHLLLRQNLPYPSSATNKRSCYRLSSKTQWKFFAHYRTLQENSFERVVGSFHTVSVLSTVQHSFRTKSNYWRLLSGRRGLLCDSNLLQFIGEPYSVLLADQGSEESCERNDRAILSFLSV